MNEQSDFERFVADQLGSAAVGTPPEAAIEDTITRAGGTRRLPEWLAILKEPPMRTNSHTAVGSPAVRVVFVMAMTLLLALALAAAGAGVQRLLAAGPIIVAQDGSGDYTTINAAVSAAADGDEIQVRPGTYVESVLVDKDITLTGDGDRAEIILDHTIDAPTIGGIATLGYTELQYGLLLKDSDATISDLTLLARGVAVAIYGGAPLIEGLVVDDPVETDSAGEAVGVEPDLWESGAFVIEDGAKPIIRDVTTDGWIFIGAAAAELTGNRIANFVYLGDGSDSAIRGNELAHLNAYRASVHTVIEDNDFTGSAWPDEDETANAIYLAINDGSEVTISGNRFGDPSYHTAVLVSGGGEVVVRNNAFRDSGTAFRLDTGSRATLDVVGNDVVANGWGIVIADHGGTVMVEGNAITDNGTGVFVNGASDTGFVDNHVCENETNVLLAVGAEAPDPAVNEICEDDAA